MICLSCKAEVPVYNGLCLNCTGRRLDRLQSALLHTISNWHQGSAELGDEMEPMHVIARTTLTHCANFLERILDQCKNF